MDQSPEKRTARKHPFGRYAFAAFVIWHLFCLMYNNLIIEEQTYNNFFLNEPGIGVAMSLIQETGVLFDIFTGYSDLTGAETGYGFYSPNVSSQMIVIFTVKDSLGDIVTVTLPHFSSNETQLRYFTAFDTFLDKLEPNNEKYDKFIDIILKSMAFRTLRNHPPHKNIDADIYVYDLPYMPQYREGHRPNYTPFVHYTYKLDEGGAQTQ